MGLRTVSITVEASCRNMWCTTPPERVTEATLGDARKVLRHHGWRFRRWYGHELVECQTHAALTDRLIREGILSRDGYILDEARWESAHAGDHR